MHGSAFDRLTRAFPPAVSRRELTRLLTGLPFGSFTVLVSDGEASHRQARRASHGFNGVSRSRRGRERRPLKGEACIPTGKRCREETAREG